MLGRVPLDRAAATASGCPTGGAPPSSCSSTLTPTEVLFSQASTGAITTLAINTSGNPLSLMCTTATVGLGQQVVVANVSATANYLYVLKVTAGTKTSAGSALITGFTIGHVAPVTLTQVVPTLTISGTGLFQSSFELQADPSGSFLTLTDTTAGLVHVLLISAADGTLSVAPGSPFPAAHALFTAATFVGAGEVLYVSDNTDGQIYVFTVDVTSLTNVLTLNSTFPEPTGLAVNFPISMQVNSIDGLLYTANTQSISIYVIQADGSLLNSAGLGSPVTPAPIFNPQLVAMDNTGSFLYVTGTGTEGVLGYAIQPNGSLVAIGGSPFASGLTGGVTDIVADLSLPQVYLLINGVISPYGVGTTTGGVLTPNPSSTQFTASGNIAIASVQ